MAEKSIIKVADFNKAVTAALVNFPPLHLPGQKPPLINGIIIDKGNLTKAALDKMADGIITKFGTPGGAALSKLVTPLPGGKILVGFQIEVN